MDAWDDNRTPELQTGAVVEVVEYGGQNRLHNNQDEETHKTN